MVGVQRELQTARRALQAVRMQRGRMVHRPVGRYLDAVSLNLLIRSSDSRGQERSS